MAIGYGQYLIRSTNSQQDQKKSAFSIFDPAPSDQFPICKPEWLELAFGGLYELARLCTFVDAAWVNPTQEVSRIYASALPGAIEEIP